MRGFGEIINRNGSNYSLAPSNPFLKPPKRQTRHSVKIYFLVIIY